MKRKGLFGLTFGAWMFGSVPLEPVERQKQVGKHNMTNLQPGYIC